MTLNDRAQLYNEKFPKWPKLVVDKGWLYGVWNIGACYKGTGYYGNYPYRYLDRVGALFPDRKDVLHLFSGSLPPGPYVRFDIALNDEAQYDVKGDAQELSNYFEPDSFDIIYADPPYSQADAEKYGCDMPNRFKVVKECAKVLRPGGHLVWLDEVLPQYRKSEFKRVGEIMITRSTNHRVRAVFIFERI